MKSRLAMAIFWIAYCCALSVVIIPGAPPWAQNTAIVIALVLAAPLCFIALRDLYRFLEALIRG